ncbi:DUF4149 domain-containing protein [Stutzerimonas stutzeri]|uniref:DUF4149 domain-containing protein n=1 Tax=Stutzerimonas stutzeri TaxID=316 RepID=A0A2N8SVF0_STUST|nr:DUF4149 domain-containing protein [Stutzerimonas stutzeri]MCQ4325708.1 DUF4149 domain-containing protein [Stutzerimonas stutzeri]PNG06451.1 DUF4149 domain-containing protein [Stutzerimonas stutzeri]
MSRSVISDSPPPRAGNISWQLAQTFWVGGLWLLQFVVLPALDKIGLAPLLIEEIGSSLRPLLVGFAAFCAVLQLIVLGLAEGFRSLWRDMRGQLLSAVLLLGISHVASTGGGALYWPNFSYLAMALCGLVLVLQPLPGARR